MQSKIDQLYKPFNGNLSRFVTLDTETTGFRQTDEILQIGLVDQDGHKLVDTLVKPQHTNKWPHAEKIHNISPKMVEKNGISYSDSLEAVRKAIASFDNIIIYNAGFDCKLFPTDFFKGKNVFCAMQLAIPILRAFPEYEPPSRFLKLKVLASLFELNTHDIDLHSAAGDAELTRRVWQFILDNENRLEVPLRDIIGEWFFYQNAGISCPT